MFPLFIIEIAALTLAVGLFGAALNVRYRDVGTVLPILLQVWMFVSPIVYASSIVPPRLHFFYALNPLAGIIEGARSALFNLPFRWASIVTSVVVALLLLVFSIHVFLRRESGFADEV